MSHPYREPSPPPPGPRWGATRRARLRLHLSRFFGVGEPYPRRLALERRWGVRLDIISALRALAYEQRRHWLRARCTCPGCQVWARE